MLAWLRARFSRFEEWARSVQDHAGLHLEISTPFGWHMQCPPDINPRTVRNFPMQSTGSEIMHVACVLAERRGIRIVATVYDAIMGEGPINQAEELSVALEQVMGMPPLSCCAATDCQPISKLSGPASVTPRRAARPCGTP